MNSVGPWIFGAVVLAGSSANAQPSIIRNPDWVKRPTAAEIVAAWPRAALLRGISGRVELSCRVNVQGLAEDCHVDSENPPALGFGAAALTLTAQFQFRPAMRDAAPFASRITVPIRFESDGRGVAPEDTIEFSLVRVPVWSEAPTFGDLAEAYPRGRHGVAGYVALRCTVKPDGGLRLCDIVHENPTGQGFGSSALRLTKLFKMNMIGFQPKPGRELKVDVPIRFIDPASKEFADRTIGEPIWLTMPDPKTASLFPIQAAEAGLRTGRALVKCVVAPDGALTACMPGPADPPNLGFSEVAVKIAAVMRMNRWSGGGGPIDGAPIVLPIRLNLDPEDGKDDDKKAGAGS